MNISEIAINTRLESETICSSLSEDKSNLPIHVEHEPPDPLHSSNRLTFAQSSNDRSILEPNRKRVRGSHYSLSEIQTLMEVIGGTNPRSDKEWDTVRRLHLLYSNQERSTKSLKKKFKQVNPTSNINEPFHHSSLMHVESYGSDSKSSHVHGNNVSSSKLMNLFRSSRYAEQVIQSDLGLHRVPRLHSLQITPVPNPLSTVVSIPDQAKPEIHFVEKLHVPSIINIPSSPESTAIGLADDDVSELGLDDSPNFN